MCLPACDPRLTSGRPACLPPLDPLGLLIHTHICAFHYRLPWMTPVSLCISFPDCLSVVFRSLHWEGPRHFRSPDLGQPAHLPELLLFIPGTSVPGCTPRRLRVHLSSSRLCLTHLESPTTSQSFYFLTRCRLRPGALAKAPSGAQNPTRPSCLCPVSKHNTYLSS